MSVAVNIMEQEMETVAPKGARREQLQVLLRSITYLAEGICAFEFVDPDGGELPAFEAGAHVDVHLPGGLIRQYSLCNAPSERHRYVVAVLREPESRGGSEAMHERMRPGDRISISSPRNQFALAEDASRHVFLAGGIGITPVKSMIAAAQARGEAFHLYYCTRSPERTAFLAELQPLIDSGHVTIHHDGGDPAQGLDLGSVLSERGDGDHLYYCGPAGFMDALEKAAADWPQECVHFERFSAPPRPDGDEPPDATNQDAFEIRLAGTGETFTVEPGDSIVDVLKANGIDVDVSCQEGYCGTCMTRYIEGEPEHHDTVLDEEDRTQYVMICCARAKNGCLVLDL